MEYERKQMNLRMEYESKRVDLRIGNDKFVEGSAICWKLIPGGRDWVAGFVGPFR